MNPQTFEISVNMDAKTFSRFAVIDMLHVKKRWKSPALFAVIMIFFAVIAFSRAGVTDGAALLGTVLAAVGLGLPIVYFAGFFFSVRRLSKIMKSDASTPVYTLTFAESEDTFGVVMPEGEEIRLEWEKIHCLYKTNGCMYLYVTKERAFLLPDADTGENRAAVLNLAASFGKVR